METVLAIKLISSNPDIRNGRPIIAGTGVCVSDIVTVMLFQQKSVDELAAWFDLSLAQIHAALAYYYEHKAAVDVEIKERRHIAAELKEKRVGNRHSLLP